MNRFEEAVLRDIAGASDVPSIELVRRRARRQRIRRAGASVVSLAALAILLVIAISVTASDRNVRVATGAGARSSTLGPRSQVQCTPVQEKLTIDAGKDGALTFDPSTPTAKAGCIQITLEVSGSSHTLQFDTPAAVAAFPQLTASENSWAGTLPPGEYSFHCTVDGHATAGMVGILTVTP